MTRVSVVIPTFARAAFLDDAIASVLAQTHADIECLVVDDCSPEPVELRDDPRVRLVRLDRNQGPAMAKNAGAAEATGEFIAFLDDDDIMTQNRVQVGLLGAHRGVTTVCRSRIDRAGLPPGTQLLTTRRYEGDMSSTMMVGPFPFVAQALMHRDDFTPFDPSFRTGEDREWWIRVCQRVTFVHVDEVGLVVREHGSARPGVDTQVRFKNRRRIMQLHRDYFKRHRAAAAYGWLGVGQAALIAGRGRDTLRFALLSFVAKPSITPARLLGALAKAQLRIMRSDK